MTVRCHALAPVWDWELRFMFAMACASRSSMGTRICASDLFRNLRCKDCFPKHPDLVVTTDSTLMR